MPLAALSSATGEFDVAASPQSRQALNDSVTHVVTVHRDDLRGRNLSEYVPAVQRIVDYGAFARLELTDEQYQQLQGSGLQFEEDEDYGIINFDRFRFDPVTDGEPALNQELVGSAASADGKSLQFVQLRNTPTSADIQMLANNVSIVQYYPNNTYLV